ncbi:MAG: TetR/AcrR family transcriptional regulator [Candidatus Borkfalkiaceae bacterium]|nr:TetR/AcrR family transcriptional regulator [Clostridia bacterium]MDY6223656.1 TetR/AcrR family transcriptional regulator [Christensenellaceae bacterium]
MKDRIIEESIASLRREGLRFSVDTLAERLNISKKTIYKYFPTKEALAVALYQKYYADLKVQAESLAGEDSVTARFKLLSLYFDAKSMTSRDIFNKYKLNEAISSFTATENERLLNIVFSSLNCAISQQDKTVLRIVINGSFEKLCNEKIAPERVINWLVNQLWQ